MNVTRDVIYDLLPGYFAGDLSPDTRVLVDEFLAQDPEFAGKTALCPKPSRSPATMPALT